MTIGYLFLMFFLILSNPSTDIKNYDINSIIYKSDLDKSLDEYTDIIDQYNEALTDDKYNELLDIGLEEPLNWYLITDYIRENQKGEFGIYFALGDIDKNGIPELFIGGNFVTETPHIYDIFVFNKSNKKALRPFYHVFGELGQRQKVFYLHNEIIEITWTSSGSGYGMEYYKISSDGYNMQCIDSISTDVSTGDGKFTRKFYHDREGTIEITEEEFDSIVNGYWGEKKRRKRDYYEESPEPLSWIEIKP